MVALDKTQLQSVYNKRAGRYNFSANLYYAVGFREYAYRKMAVQALALKRGNTVVEVSCGTGLNFPILRSAVGAEGRIIGVDLTEMMLKKAQQRVDRNGWKNVQLIRADAAHYVFPRGIQGILSSFAITLIPEFDEIIKAGAEALSPGGRWVVLDFKLPSNALAFLVPLAVSIMKPFGVTLDLANRHPWGRCVLTRLNLH